MQRLGHRGVLAFENTARGIKSALAQGLDGVEIDVHLSRDQQLVVFHDVDLQRMAGRSERVDELTLDELVQVQQYCGEPILGFDDLLSWWPRDACLNVEVKEGGLPLIRQLLPRISTLPTLVLSSFDADVLMNIREEGFNGELALLLDHESPPWLFAHGANELQCNTVHLHASLAGPKRITTLLKDGVALCVWGSRTASMESKLGSVGVKRLIVDV